MLKDLNDEAERNRTNLLKQQLSKSTAEVFLLVATNLNAEEILHFKFLTYNIYKILLERKPSDSECHKPAPCVG